MSRHYYHPNIPAMPPSSFANAPYVPPMHPGFTSYSHATGLPLFSGIPPHHQQAIPHAHDPAMPPQRPLSPGHTPIWPAGFEIIPPPFPTISTAPAEQFWEPGTFPPVPFNTPVPIRLHPHIIYNPMNVYFPTLQWDILHQAEQARVITGRGFLVPADLKVQGLLPAANMMWIYSDHPYLTHWMAIWGPIIIEKTNMSVRDILDGIWGYFQQYLTDEDRRRIRASPGGLRNLKKSAMLRIEDSYDLSAVARKQGFKRVDVLGCLRRFQGLRVVAYADNTWKAYMGLMPGPVPRVPSS